MEKKRLPPYRSLSDIRNVLVNPNQKIPVGAVALYGYDYITDASQLAMVSDDGELLVRQISHDWSIFSQEIITAAGSVLYKTLYGRAVDISFHVESTSGTSPTLNFYIQYYNQGKSYYYDRWSVPQITADGTYWYSINPLTTDRVKIRWEVGGTTPSFELWCSFNGK